MLPHVDQILVSRSSFDWQTGFPNDQSISKMSKIENSYPGKVSIYEMKWETRYAQLQYSLDYIKSNYKKTSHCILIDDKQDISNTVIEESISYTKKRKFLTVILNLNSYRKLIILIKKLQYSH